MLWTVRQYRNMLDERRTGVKVCCAGHPALPGGEQAGAAAVDAGRVRSGRHPQALRLHQIPPRRQ